MSVASPGSEARHLPKAPENISQSALTGTIYGTILCAGDTNHSQLPVCAQRIVPMSLPPSVPLGASVTTPNGASGSVVPAVLDQRWRHVSTSFIIMQL